MTQSDIKTILVVDDEPDVRQYLKAILEDAGFNVITAEDGQAALDIIKTQTPDFISLDLMMPKKSVSGVFAVTDEEYIACQYCPKKCEDRASAFRGEYHHR